MVGSHNSHIVEILTPAKKDDGEEDDSEKAESPTTDVVFPPQLRFSSKSARELCAIEPTGWRRPHTGRRRSVGIRTINLLLNKGQAVTQAMVFIR